MLYKKRKKIPSVSGLVSPPLSFSNTYLAKWHTDVIAVDPDDMDQWVNLSLTLHKQLDIIHVEEMAERCSTSEPRHMRGHSLWAVGRVWSYPSSKHSSIHLCGFES